MSSETKKQGGFHYAFLIVASCIVIVCVPCALVLSCSGIYYTPLAEYFQVPRASVTLYFTILNIGMVITLPIAGKLMSTVDARIIMTTCVIIDGVVMLCMSQVQEVWQLYVCGAFLGIGTAPLLSLATPSLVNAWCKKKVGFFIGLCMAFTGIGGVIFNPVGTALITMGPEGWRMGYTVFGILILVCTLPFTIFVLRSRPEDKGLIPYGAEGVASEDGSPSVAATGVSASKAMKTPVFFCVALICLLFALNQTIYQFLPSYCSSFADTMPAIAALSGVVASACMAGQAIGKVVLGIVNDKSPHAGLFLCVGSGLVGVALMWFLPSFAALMLIGGFAFGFVYAGMNVETPLITRTVFGSRDYTNIWSRVSMVGTLGGVIAPTLFGVLVDLPGGFDIMFAVGYACMALIIVLGLYCLKKAKSIEHTTE
ncbi:MAG: MFS transporter [Eggerthellaceae bacterium]